MKNIIEEAENEGLVSLLGKEIVVFCMNYTYAGKLIGVNKTCILLKNGGIIYETGTSSEPEWKDFQRLPTDKVYLQSAAIESFMEVKREEV